MRLREHVTLHSELSAVACWRHGTYNEKEYDVLNMKALLNALHGELMTSIQAVYYDYYSPVQCIFIYF
jgi:hypothetical protein